MILDATNEMEPVSPAKQPPDQIPETD